MELLLSILFCLGISLTTEEITNINSESPEYQNVVLAKHIMDDHLYHYDDAGVIIIDVNPNQ
jgi:hypothetical protein